MYIREKIMRKKFAHMYIIMHAYNVKALNIMHNIGKLIIFSILPNVHNNELWPIDLHKYYRLY